MSMQPTDDRSIGELLSTATADLGRLVRQEIELAKTETKEELRTAARVGAMFGAAAVVGFLLLALFAAAWGLAEVMPIGVAFLIVALVAGIVAFAAFSVARERFKDFDPVPQQTAETIKEDVEWLKTRKN
jgi:formate hydrogenlyase subunit 3/multisubunit Na+/H+ antiporter MnhD subunit